MSKSDIKGEMRLQPNININPIHSQHFRLPSPVAPSNPLSFFNGKSRRKWRKAIKCFPRDDLSPHIGGNLSSRAHHERLLDVIEKYFIVVACLNAKWKREVIGILSEQVKVYSSSRCFVLQRFYSLETRKLFADWIGILFKHELAIYAGNYVRKCKQVFTTQLCLHSKSLRNGAFRAIKTWMLKWAG